MSWWSRSRARLAHARGTIRVVRTDGSLPALVPCFECESAVVAASYALPDLAAANIYLSVIEVEGKRATVTLCRTCAARINGADVMAAVDLSVETMKKETDRET